ncbi:MAG: DUF4296 domain-containing protein [Rikenellaceae bacterium]
MTRFLYIILTLLLITSSCSRSRVIKDKDLELILHDMFLQNAYSSEKKLKLDSLNIYKPIFEKYGYKEVDMLTTLTEFSRRKSSKFSVVLDKAIKRMDGEYELLQGKVAMLDTVSNIAKRRYLAVVYQDSLLSVKSEDDLKFVELRLPAKEGRYKLEFEHKFHDLAKNFSFKTEFGIFDDKKHQLFSRNVWVNTANLKGVDIVLDAPERADSLIGKFIVMPKSQKFSPLDIHSIKVTYFLDEKSALDSLYRQYMNYELLIDDIPYYDYPKDSITFFTDPEWYIIQRDSISFEQGDNN